MLEIHKQYVFDENGTAIAVQIPIDEFEKIEKIVAKSQDDSSNDHSSEQTQEECELVEVDGLLVVRAQGAENIDVTEFINQQREERIREVGGW